MVIILKLKNLVLPGRLQRAVPGYYSSQLHRPKKKISCLSTKISCVELILQWVWGVRLT